MTKIKKFKRIEYPKGKERYLEESEIRAIVSNAQTFLSEHARLTGGSIKSGNYDSGGGFKIDDSGLIVNELGPGSIPSIQGWGNTMTFSAVDHDTVEWTAGAVTLSDGTIYDIVTGNTGNMSTTTYIYFDFAVSQTILQTTTTQASAVGNQKIMVGVAKNNSDTASDAQLQVFGGTGGILLSVDNIVANSASVNAFVANTANIADAVITSAKIGSLNADIIDAGTMTGRTVISSTSNNSIRLTNGNLFEFYYGGSRKTYLRADASGDLSIHTLDDVLFILGGNSKLGVYGSALRPAVDNAYDLGSPSLRFEDTYSVDVYTNEVHCGTYKGGGVTTEYNKDNNGRDVEWDSYGNKRMKCNQDGNLGIDGSYSDGGADFAEYFESVDGKKIPKGTSVILVGDKIQKAKQGEEPIGVISVTPTIIGNAGGSDTGTNWTGKYLKNEWGEYIMEKKEFWIKKKPTITHKREDVRQDDKRLAQFKKYKKNNPMSGWSDETTPPPNVTLKTAERRKVNPNWDKTKKYKERKDRDEWNIVGLVGRLKVLKTQVVNKNWIKLRDISPTASEYLIK